MGSRRRNTPFVIWAAFFLWFTSIFAIAWSSFLFFCLGEILLITGTDLVNLFVLLSGLIMLPTTMKLMYCIANGKSIQYNMAIRCCPLWICIVWIILINLIGIVVTIQRLTSCYDSARHHIVESMKHYRSVPKYKHFIDNIQWSLKCCGLNSYKDWFAHDWYDKIRDYEWNPADRRVASLKGKSALSDSVPLSCCKSGSCVANYLSELGTYAINTDGCSRKFHRYLMVSLYGYLFFFSLIIVFQVALLRSVVVASSDEQEASQKLTEIHHIMTARKNFDTSVTSDTNIDATDSDAGNKG